MRIKNNHMVRCVLQWKIGKKSCNSKHKKQGRSKQDLSHWVFAIVYWILQIYFQDKNFMDSPYREFKFFSEDFFDQGWWVIFHLMLKLSLHNVVFFIFSFVSIYYACSQECSVTKWYTQQAACLKTL